MTEMDKVPAFCVELWGSDPEEMNDDCWTSIDFATREEAEAFYAAPTADKFSAYASAHTTAWLALAFAAPDHSTWELISAKPNPLYDAKRAKREEEESDAAERSERRMQAGMGGGCDWYNDAD